jgi:hypothetical protein
MRSGVGRVNEYWQQWYESLEFVNDQVLSSDIADDGLINPALGAGAVTLGVTTAGAYLMWQPHPAGKALGAALIALPDPVVYAVAYSILA